VTGVGSSQNARFCGLFASSAGLMRQGMKNGSAWREKNTGLPETKK
jgi:hypothetical protein